jgi:acyl dehydratase
MTYVPSLPILYFEDFQVGQRFTSRTYPLDEKQIIDFARQFDPQPFHTDAETAKDTFFHGLIASGWHTGAITMRLLVETLPIAGGVIGAGGEVNWPQPTRPGDILRVEGEITQVRLSNSHSDRGLIIAHYKTLNQRNEIVQDAIGKIIAFRRPN